MPKAAVHKECSLPMCAMAGLEPRPPACRVNMQKKEVIALDRSVTVTQPRERDNFSSIAIGFSKF